LAPRPGLEPGTYGLTVPPKRNSTVLINVDKIYINQLLMRYLTRSGVD
jgi:hypothetical protein